MSSGSETLSSGSETLSSGKRCALVHSSIPFALTHVKIDSINKRLVLKF
ncbi:hypothetical protein [Leptospira noguchii]